MEKLSSCIQCIPQLEIPRIVRETFRLQPSPPILLRVALHWARKLRTRNISDLERRDGRITPLTPKNFQRNHTHYSPHPSVGEKSTPESWTMQAAKSPDEPVERDRAQVVHVSLRPDARHIAACMYMLDHNFSLVHVHRVTKTISRASSRAAGFALPRGPLSCNKAAPGPTAIP